MKSKTLQPISFSGGVKSISDDDLCSQCGHCDYQPGEMSGCSKEWPGLEDVDGYVQECKEMTAGIKVKLVSSEHGFKDFDVTNLPNVHRACIGHGIKKGDIFNVYCSNCVKLGAIWCGDVVQSLTNFAATNTLYQQLCDEADGIR